MRWRLPAMPDFMELTMASGRLSKKKVSLIRVRPGGKSRILDELVELTGWHRDYAHAALRDALVLKITKPRPRTPVYGPELLPALIRRWTVMRTPAGKLLAPM